MGKWVDDIFFLASWGMFHDPSIHCFGKKVPRFSAETTQTPESVHPGLGAWTLANWRSSLQAYQNQTLQGAHWSHRLGGGENRGFIR